MTRPLLLVFLMIWTLLACAEESDVHINKDGETYVLDVVYPQHFSKAVNDAIHEAIDKKIDEFLDELLDELLDESDLPADIPGKSGLNIRYKTVWQHASSLSFRFDISTFHKGAAHPNNTILTMNFIDEKEVRLKDLFKANEPWIDLFSKQAYQYFMNKKIADKNWIQEGTRPTNDNFDLFNFTDTGISLIFDTYQVAPYVMGPQTMIMTKAQLTDMLKPELVSKIWG